MRRWAVGQRLRLLAGGLIALMIGALVISLIVSLIAVAPAGAQSGLDLAHYLRMAGIQAGLTTIASLVVGIALAFALDRLRFAGRGPVQALLGAAIVLPGLVAAMGLLTVWGRNGWVAHLIAPFGRSTGGSLYGLVGIVAAHIILDASYVATVLGVRLSALPATRLKMGQSLRLSGWRRFRIVDWPSIRGALPGLASLVFLLAFTSFPIVLLLGGGPANQTLEAAIYGLVRFEFDLGAAAQLGLVQIGFCALILIPAAIAMPGIRFGGSGAGYFWADSGMARFWASVFLSVGLGFILVPLLAVLADGIAYASDLLRAPWFPRAFATSLLLGALSAGLALMLALFVALGRAAAGVSPIGPFFSFAAFSYLAVPGVVLSLGFLLLARQAGLPINQAAPYVLLLANALLTLPFALTTLAPTVASVTRRYERICRSLNLGGWRRWRAVEWPLLGRECGLVFALGFCFSLGDLTVISLFGTQDFSTLPLEMLRASGAYRTHDASAIAALMLVLTALVFFVAPRLFRRWSHAQN